MRVAITGADGFTGRYVTAELDRRAVAWTAIACDLREAGHVEEHVRSTPFTHLIHLAGIAYANSDDWMSYYRVNHLGAFGLLDAAARHRPGARCLIASSAQVYGFPEVELIGEDHPCRPYGHYGASKLAMEVSASLLQGPLDILVTRPFNYTGVGQEDRFLIPKLVKLFRERAPVVELGNTAIARDFSDVRMVSRLYCDLLLSTPANGALNICTGKMLPLDSIIDRLREMTGHDPEIRVNPEFVRASDPLAFGGDPARLERAVGYTVDVDFGETLAWMLEGGV